MEAGGSFMTYPHKSHSVTSAIFPQLPRSVYSGWKGLLPKGINSLQTAGIVGNLPGGWANTFTKMS